MKLYQLVLLLLLGATVVYVQLRYAWANYPNTRQWKSILFVSAFVCGFFGTVILLYQEWADIRMWSVGVLIGTFSGLIFTFLAPGNMQASYPKREDIDGGSDPGL